MKITKRELVATYKKTLPEDVLDAVYRTIQEQPLMLWLDREDDFWEGRL